MNWQNTVFLLSTFPVTQIDLLSPQLHCLGTTPKRAALSQIQRQNIHEIQRQNIHECIIECHQQNSTLLTLKPRITQFMLFLAEILSVAQTKFLTPLADSFVDDNAAITAIDNRISERI
jgi:hypothetical protein